jgi:hypothetical protein
MEIKDDKIECLESIKNIEVNTNSINKENKENSEINKDPYRNISKEDEDNIENNPILKQNNCNYLFILKNYGKCASFINEIVQTEGITMYEHLKLKEIMRVNKIK